MVLFAYLQASALQPGWSCLLACCRYMQRYAYDFVVNVDTDEFLWLRSDFMRKPKPLKVWSAQPCHT